MQEALYSARWCRLRSLFRGTCRKVLLACTMNRAQLLLRSLKLRLRAMLGMVRAQRWRYLQRPRPWREFHHCFGVGGGAGGAVSSSTGRASIEVTRVMVYTHKNPEDADIAPHKPQVWENRAKAARVGYCVGLKVMSIQPRSWSMLMVYYH